MQTLKPNHPRFGGLRVRAVVIGAAALVLGTTQVTQAGINVWTTNGPSGAAVKALAIDPSTPSTLYAGTAPGFIAAPGGVFQSTNSGGSWSAGTGLSDAALFIR